MNITQNSMKRSFYFGLGLGIFFIVWAILVASHSSFITTFDNFYINLIYNNNPTLISFAKHITVIGNTSTIFVLTIILFIALLLWKKYPYAWLTAGTMIIANGSNWILKHLIQRQRPTFTHFIKATGYSFPSGHSVGSASLFGLLIVLTCLIVKNKKWRIIISLIWGLFPLIIGYTRIFLHVHFPSDVFGGWLEGSTYVLLCFSLYQYLSLKKQGKNF